MAEILTSGDIDTSWLTQILRTNELLDDETEVASFDLQPFGDAESMMSSLLRVTLQYDGDNAARQA